MLDPGRTGGNEDALFTLKFHDFKRVQIFPSPCRIYTTFMTDVQKPCNFC